MRTLAQEAQGGLRTIAGEVASAGTAMGGTGFVSSKTGTGAYTVRFAPPFKFPTTAVEVQVRGGNTATIVTAVAADSFSVVVFNTNSFAQSDAGFMFTAVGR